MLAWPHSPNQGGYLDVSVLEWQVPPKVPDGRDIPASNV